MSWTLTLAYGADSGPAVAVLRWAGKGRLLAVSLRANVFSRVAERIAALELRLGTVLFAADESTIVAMTGPTLMRLLRAR